METIKEIIYMDENDNDNTGYRVISSHGQIIELLVTSNPSLNQMGICSEEKPITDLKNNPFIGATILEKPRWKKSPDFHDDIHSVIIETSAGPLELYIGFNYEDSIYAQWENYNWKDDPLCLIWENERKKEYKRRIYGKN